MVFIYNIRKSSELNWPSNRSWKVFSFFSLLLLSVSSHFFSFFSHFISFILQAFYTMAIAESYIHQENGLIDKFQRRSFLLLTHWRKGVKKKKRISNNEIDTTLRGSFRKSRISFLMKTIIIQSKKKENWWSHWPLPRLQSKLKGYTCLLFFDWTCNLVLIYLCIYCMYRIYIVHVIYWQTIHMESRGSITVHKIYFVCMLL